MVFVIVGDEIYLFAALGIAGGALRVLFGYSKLFQFRIPFDVGRTWFALLIGVISGGLAALLGTSITSAIAPNWPPLAVAILAGFGGPDTFEALWKAFVKRIGGGTPKLGAGDVGASLPSYYGEELKERQLRAIEFARKKGGITNDKYQKITGVSDATASRDLAELVKSGVLKIHGRGRGIFYTFK